MDYREQASGKPQIWRDNTASTAQRAYLRLDGLDVGVVEDANQAQGVRPRIGYGQQAATYTHSFGDTINEEGRAAGHEEAVGLMVRDVERNDSAVYRCRVDLLLSQTRNTRVNLTVVGECLCVVCGGGGEGAPPRYIISSVFFFGGIYISLRRDINLLFLSLNFILFQAATLSAPDPPINLRNIEHLSFSFNWRSAKIE